MYSKQGMVICCALLMVMIGFGAVQGAAVRDRRQLNTLLNLSGESNARIENGTLICDTLKCPDDAFKCVIAKNNTKANLQEIVVTRECLDEAGKIKAKTVEKEVNKFPGTHFESYAELDKNGNIASFDNRGNSYNHAGSGDLHSYLYSQIDDLHKAILDQLHGQQTQTLGIP
ncbi:uncharacterized protein LOC129747047 [Uranotaenia lowii]|uniref:uncharacterized protein LOC129747047 n=1 Tax=Uranotaenia lowii TaxID=190385 RepID=UPI0024787E91|nr:uncharacterized protein LOC129747047 [Uranotaenia lowii]